MAKDDIESIWEERESWEKWETWIEKISTSTKNLLEAWLSNNVPKRRLCELEENELRDFIENYEWLYQSSDIDLIKKNHDILNWVYETYKNYYAINDDILRYFEKTLYKLSWRIVELKLLSDNSAK